MNIYADFNPRLREGGDDTHNTLIDSIANFNPRLREGGDLTSLIIPFVIITISIHASAKEATIMHDPISSIFVFQSTPPRRRRPITFLSGCLSNSISIHASAKEATLFRIRYILPILHFNPRLREGGDIAFVILINPIINFNPRLREGGD